MLEEQNIPKETFLAPPDINSLKQMEQVPAHENCSSVAVGDEKGCVCVEELKMAVISI